MTWGLAASTMATTHRMPMARIVNSRGQDFSYSSTGWASGPSEEWKGGSGSSSKSASNAAVSALALLAFLFFLNMLQQQLALGQQQTLLFMTNSSNFTRIRPLRRPFLTIAKVQAKSGINYRPRMTIKAMANAMLKKVRRQRDVDAVQQENEEPETALNANELEEIGARGLPFMMQGLPDGSSKQLSAWLRGQLNADELQTDLVDILTSCRAVVACTVHKMAGAEGKKSPSVLSDEAIRKLLGEAGEYSEPGQLDEACDFLLQEAGTECRLLAESFSSLIPTVKHEPFQDPLLIDKNPKGNF